jgi:hypothetical protein
LILRVIPSIQQQPQDSAWKMMVILYPVAQCSLHAKKSCKEKFFLYGMALRHKSYKPKPLQCTICLAHGHSKNNCKQSLQSCRKCGKPSHVTENCTEKDACCKNCKNKGHTALEKQLFPANHKRAEILQTSVRLNLPYSVVAATIPRQPTPSWPLNSQTEVSRFQRKQVPPP